MPRLVTCYRLYLHVCTHIGCMWQTTWLWCCFLLFRSTWLKYHNFELQFIVLNRYSTTVQEYIEVNRISDPRVSTLLLLQLLEGIAHLTRHGVAHRDLKTDNLLLDESTSGLCPRLVIADFGCCLADREWGLVLPFYTAEIDRGGNSTLMAPEVQNNRV